MRLSQSLYLVFKKCVMESTQTYFLSQEVTTQQYEIGRSFSLLALMMESDYGHVQSTPEILDVSTFYMPRSR